VVGIRLAHRPALTLTVTAAATVAGLWVFGGLAQDVIGSEEFFFFDLSAVRYLAAHPLAALTTSARAINLLTLPPWLLLAGLVIAAVTWRSQPRIAGATGLSLAGQWLIVELTVALVNRAPPAVVPMVARFNYGFPSEHVAMVTALACLAAWPWTRPGWRRTVVRFGAATIVVTLTGTARVILLVEYPSDTIGGAAVAAAWTLLVCLAFDPERRSAEQPGTGQ
ncbi:MAG TPA: phosphatase PAP2 family protein, partial [Acidimicrobiia bacterium]|nr:phosphatase PAP2 family protein [Acidimicrobiia bacterium]